MAQIDDILMQCCQEGCIYHPDQPAEGQIQLCYYQGTGYTLALRLNCEFRLIRSGMSDDEARGELQAEFARLPEIHG